MNHLSSYLGIKDDYNKSRNFIIVRRPPPEKYKKVWLRITKLYKGRILGISSNRYFPKDVQYVTDHASGWFHCFRDTKDILPDNLPCILLSESDFTKPDILQYSSKKKEFDIVYSCKKGQKKTKNFGLFMRCLPKLKDYKIHLMLHGFSNKEIHFINKKYNNVFITTKSFGRREFFRQLSRSRVGFFPNETDASPRVLTECLAMNMPVVVNKNIVGGWKYINPNTGYFFQDENDVMDSVQQSLDFSYDKNRRINEYFKEEHYEESRKNLAQFITKLYPDEESMFKSRLCHIKRI